ncbi:N-acyl homoserine lactonase AttM [Alphaproteobacteria bacterium SO-S41]|nr:N-acyl homoserine lactonase AttM [Alphaproteobacteria bacterium SO-S41]
MVCGTLTAPMEAFVEGGTGMITVPIPAYYIEHPEGRVVVDTGMPAGLRTDPEAAIGRFLAGLYVAGFTPEQDVDKQLQAIGVDPASIDTVINTHLHFDHCAGNRLLPNARIVVQAREVAATKAAGPPKSGFDAMTMLDGRDVMEVDGEHDLFGDGAVVLLPTYGHTAGHQSLKLACDGGETVLTGDCCYFHRTLSDLKLPGFAHDHEEQLRSIARLKTLADRGARVIAGHDPDQWQGNGPVVLSGA